MLVDLPPVFLPLLLQVVVSVLRDAKLAGAFTANGERDSHGIQFSLSVAGDGVGDTGIVCQQPR